MKQASYNVCNKLSLCLTLLMLLSQQSMALEFLSFSYDLGIYEKPDKETLAGHLRIKSRQCISASEQEFDAFEEKLKEPASKLKSLNRRKAQLPYKWSSQSDLSSQADKIAAYKERLKKGRKSILNLCERHLGDGLDYLGRDFRRYQDSSSLFNKHDLMGKYNDRMREFENALKKAHRYLEEDLREYSNSLSSGLFGKQLALEKLEDQHKEEIERPAREAKKKKDHAAFTKRFELEIRAARTNPSKAYTQFMKEMSQQDGRTESKVDYLMEVIATDPGLKEFKSQLIRELQPYWDSEEPSWLGLKRFSGTEKTIRVGEFVQLYLASIVSGKTVLFRLNVDNTSPIMIHPSHGGQFIQVGTDDRVENGFVYVFAFTNPTKFQSSYRYAGRQFLPVMYDHSSALEHPFLQYYSELINVLAARPPEKAYKPKKPKNTDYCDNNRENVCRLSRNWEDYDEDTRSLLWDKVIIALELLPKSQLNNMENDEMIQEACQHLHRNDEGLEKRLESVKEKYLDTHESLQAASFINNAMFSLREYCSVHYTP